MADTNETIDDIIAEMHYLAEHRDWSNHTRQSNRERVSNITDRLEAAHKRERGDCAKLREALINVATALAVCEWPDGTDIEGVKMMRHDIDAALAAPPRNCDVAQDWLRDLYVNFKPPASVKREMPPEWVDAVMAFCRWLVAPATEKEGGAE